MRNLIPASQRAISLAKQSKKQNCETQYAVRFGNA
jgi:hypothetical protein